MNTQVTSATILNPGFNYINSAKTDIARTFERHGFVRPDVRKQLAARLLLNGVDLTSLDAGVVAAQAALV